jgi:hypothetical protein
MKLRHLLAAAIVVGAGFVTPLRAQAPGGLNKVSHDSTGKTAKQAGHVAKGKVHHVLMKASKTRKAGLKRATSVTTKTHVPKHKARGAKKLAHKVTPAGKQTGAAKKTPGEGQAALTKAGKDTKEAIKKQ